MLIRAGSQKWLALRNKAKHSGRDASSHHDQQQEQDMGERSSSSSSSSSDHRAWTGRVEQSGRSQRTLRQKLAILRAAKCMLEEEADEDPLCERHQVPTYQSPSPAGLSRVSRSRGYRTPSPPPRPPRSRCSPRTAQSHSHHRALRGSVSPGQGHVQDGGLFSPNTLSATPLGQAKGEVEDHAMKSVDEIAMQEQDLDILVRDLERLDASRPGVDDSNNWRLQRDILEASIADLRMKLSETRETAAILSGNSLISPAQDSWNSDRTTQSNANDRSLDISNFAISQAADAILRGTMTPAQIFSPAGLNRSQVNVPRDASNAPAASEVCTSTQHYACDGTGHDYAGPPIRSV